MKNINIEQIQDGYLLSWWDEGVCEQQKCFEPSMAGVTERLSIFFDNISELLDSEFTGFVGLTHSIYPEDF